MPLNRWLTSGIGMMLGILAHSTAWPFPKGGAQSLVNALEKEFGSLGGLIQVGWPITHLDELPTSRVTLLDITPRQFLGMAGDRVRELAKRRWSGYRYGPGVFKVDYALSAPIPWSDPACAKAACLHLGANFAEIAQSERNMGAGTLSPTPFVLLAQHSLFDSTRAPSGCHTAWAYCHVPHGFPGDARALIDQQIERFAPGFKDIVLAAHEIGPTAMEKYNANYIGGDINGGMQDLWQMWTRPIAQLDPYATPLPAVFLCSSSTPPGGGVHGMSGFYAAQSALKILASV
jgi:phytoene dehydrogenase-like protein